MENQMTILSYGEDGLTLWALRDTEKFQEILSQLGEENINPNDKRLILYRPSFGRGGKSKKNIGEFDAIIASEKNIYLVESKWDNLKKGKTDHSLKKNQALRHDAFAWLLDKWNDNDSNDWSHFFRANEEEYSREFRPKTLAKDSDLLAKNLTSVLKKISRHFSGEIPVATHVLLYFYDENTSSGLETVDHEPVGDRDELEFKKVNIPHGLTNESAYFEL